MLRTRLYLGLLPLLLLIVATGGPMGASVEVPGLPGARVMTIRLFGDRLETLLTQQVGTEVRLLPLSDWLETVDPAYRDVHSEALATGEIAASPIPAHEQYAASLPLFASTGEAVLLIETRLPEEEVAGAVSSLVRQLVITLSAPADRSMIAACEPFS